ncbi:MAG: Fe-S cluster assembly protein SufD [Bernardetiaceae bacterium]|jgi:Fe-S cluster assembly protein SufD|nr:Fe-S cluster assembly protein SufD [Bernardetiaceae bacterium]
MPTAETTDFKQMALARLADQAASQNDQQRAAAQVFARLDAPTRKHEEWKYLDLRQLLGQSYQLAPAQPQWAAIDPLLHQYAEDQANVLVFVNGQYAPEHSRVVSNPAQVVVCPLAEARQKYPDVVAAHLGQYAQYGDHFFAALNSAWAANGAFVWVKPNQTVAEPIIAHYVTDSSEASTLVHLRNLVVVGTSSQCTFIEHYNSTPSAFGGLTNLVAELAVGANAHLDHYKIQDEAANASHIGLTQAHQQADSRYYNTTISLSGQIVRNNLGISIDGSNCEAYMNGLMVLTGQTLVDNHTAVDHLKPHSQSNQLYKGLLDGRSTGVFNGKIYVRPDAQKTNAYQSSKNILLSDSATVDAKPQLEIWADDVKCSHGHATGALDEEPLFYLRARGIALEQARAMLMFAFADDVLARLSYAPVRDHIEKIIAERLRWQD